MTGDSNQRPARSGFERRWQFQPTPHAEARSGARTPGGLRSPGGVGPGIFDAPVRDGEKQCDEPTDSSS